MVTQRARETFDSRIRAAVTSRQLVWFGLGEWQGTTFCDCGTIEKC